MKSPADIGRYLAKQWQQNAVREARLLSPAAWPWVIPIGKPSPVAFTNEASRVQQHLHHWQQVKVGEVQWESVNYRAGAKPVLMPVRWCLQTPTQWIAATLDMAIAEEYACLEQLIGKVDEIYHRLLIRQRALWQKKNLDEVIQTAHLASRLSPGCAQGRPLRLLSGFGVDTKWIERNSRLLARLLDERFDGAASEHGLVTFLDALDEGDHWVLLVPLSTGLLPFRRSKITTAELAKTALPGSRLLVVENEQCIHLLPELPDTLAVLGAGLDLQWLMSAHLRSKSIAYWGDMDTWGLQMLARARSCCPALTPLLMNRLLFDQYAVGRAVQEPVPAQPIPPEGLTSGEADFYQYLLCLLRGRFEQEYLPGHEVEKALVAWCDQQNQTLPDIR